MTGESLSIDPAIVEVAAEAMARADGQVWTQMYGSRAEYYGRALTALRAAAPLLVKGEREAIERSKLNILEELGRANRVIQKAAMLLGSTDEWTDQGAMIADFEQRFAAGIGERGKAS